jgi:hypothetical protein
MEAQQEYPDLQQVLQKFYRNGAFAGSNTKMPQDEPDFQPVVQIIRRNKAISSSHSGNSTRTARLPAAIRTCQKRTRFPTVGSENPPHQRDLQQCFGKFRCVFRISFSRCGFLSADAESLLFFEECRYFFRNSAGSFRHRANSSCVPVVFSVVPWSFPAIVPVLRVFLLFFPLSGWLFRDHYGTSRHPLVFSVVAVSFPVIG